MIHRTGTRAPSPSPDPNPSPNPDPDPNPNPSPTLILTLILALILTLTLTLLLTVGSVLAAFPVVVRTGKGYVEACHQDVNKGAMAARVIDLLRADDETFVFCVGDVSARGRARGGARGSARGRGRVRVRVRGDLCLLRGRRAPRPKP